MVRPSPCDSLDVRVWFRLADGAPGKRVAWMRACLREASRRTAAQSIWWGGGEVLSKHACVWGARCGAAGCKEDSERSWQRRRSVNCSRMLTEPWLGPACLAQTNTGRVASARAKRIFEITMLGLPKCRMLFFSRFRAAAAKETRSVRVEWNRHIWTRIASPASRRRLHRILFQPTPDRQTSSAEQQQDTHLSHRTAALEPDSSCEHYCQNTVETHGFRSSSRHPSRSYLSLSYLSRSLTAWHLKAHNMSSVSRSLQRGGSPSDLRYAC